VRTEEDLAILEAVLILWDQHQPPYMGTDILFTLVVSKLVVTALTRIQDETPSVPEPPCFCQQIVSPFNLKRYETFFARLVFGIPARGVSKIVCPPSFSFFRFQN